MLQSKHVYALFEDKQAASNAYEELRAGGCSDEHCSVLLHRGPLEEGDLGIVESASHEGARKGAMTLGAVGAGLGAVSGGLLGVGFLAGLALGGGLLAIYGGIFGGIAGADEPERQVRALERQLENGAVLIAVKTDDPGLIEMCQGVLERNGGHPFVA